jgi:hypothetical protein
VRQEVDLKKDISEEGLGTVADSQPVAVHDMVPLDRSLSSAMLGAEAITEEEQRAVK